MTDAQDTRTATEEIVARGRDGTPTTENGVRITRRAALGGLGGLGALAASGAASTRNRRPGKPAVDVVVVGAGYAGPIIAGVLAEEGKRVVVLEAGPERGMKDLVSSQIWARGLHGPYAVSTQGANPIGVGSLVGWGLGGSGLHHFGTWPRMHPVDFEMQSRFGRALDWPIGYDDLRPYYDRIQERVGISGDAEAEVWRPPGDPYPLPPHELHTQATVLKRGFDDLGLRTAPMPNAILSQPYKGRPACRYVGWCNAGCAIGALGHPLATVIPDAKRAGVRFRTDARALRVVTDRGRAAGVEYADHRGRRQVQRARLVVLAAWSLETPRILLNSKDGGLANSSGLVGRHIHQHVLADILGLFEETTDPHRGHITGQLLCQEGIDPDPQKGYIGGHQWIIAGASKPNDLIVGMANARSDLRGPDLEPFMRRAAKHMAGFSGLGFSTAQRENGLTLVDERDEYGMRKAVLTHAFDGDALALHDAVSQEGLEIMSAAGAQEAWADSIRGAHVMGGTIMGDDPSASVTTSYGQTHDVENLFLAGAGLFPSGAAVNPTFTLNALALRSAEFIKNNWSHLT